MHEFRTIISEGLYYGIPLNLGDLAHYIIFNQIVSDVKTIFTFGSFEVVLLGVGIFEGLGPGILEPGTLGALGDCGVDPGALEQGVLEPGDTGFIPTLRVQGILYRSAGQYQYS